MFYPQGASLLCFISLLAPSLLSTHGPHAGWILQTIPKPMKTGDALTVLLVLMGVGLLLLLLVIVLLSRFAL